MEQVTLFNGDCMDFLKGMDSASVDLVVTDPPYLIGTRGAGMYRQADKRYIGELEKIKDGFSENILDELCRVMRRINIYLFCSQRQIIPLLDYFAVKRKCSWNIISWHKTNPVPACGNKYLTDTEFALFFREKGVRLYGSFGTKRTWYATPLNQSGKRLYGHPTVKPLEIVENFIVNSCPPGGAVLDPFMGSGTTGVAALRRGCRFIGCEISGEYYAVAERRILGLPEQKQLELFS